MSSPEQPSLDRERDVTVALMSPLYEQNKAHAALINPPDKYVKPKTPEELLANIDNAEARVKTVYDSLYENGYTTEEVVRGAEAAVSIVRSAQEETFQKKR